MSYCTRCGGQINRGESPCPYCRKPLKEYTQRNKPQTAKMFKVFSITSLILLFIFGGYYLYRIWQSDDYNLNKDIAIVAENGTIDEPIIIRKVAFDDSNIIESVINEEITSDHSSSERYFQILNVDINFKIQDNGVIEARERRTYDFNGNFKGLIMWFSKKEGIDFIDFEVEENGEFFEFNPGSTYGPTGTFYIDEDSDSVLVDWSIEAEDEIRSFELHYKVLNAIKFQGDQAEIYWQFIGDGWDVPTEKVFISLVIPEGASIKEIEAFGYGPSHGKVSVIKPNEIIWEIDYLPERTFLEGRVIFPARLLR